MEEPKDITVVDPGAGLPNYLTRFDLLEFNNLLVSHFYCFETSFPNFICFSIPAKGLPLLEELLRFHKDFISSSNVVFS